MSLNLNINKQLLTYLNNKIRSRYKSHDGAHNIEHLDEVLKRALELGKEYGVDEKYLYVCAYYHDLGLDAGRENHEMVSGKYLRNDKNLLRWFSKDEIELMAQAVEDHRASLDGPPRSLLGKIISDADRVMIPERVIERSLKFNRENNPALSNEDLINSVYSYLKKKYGKKGYSKLNLYYLPQIKEQTKLKEILNDFSKFRTLASQIIKKDHLFPKLKSIMS